MMTKNIYKSLFLLILQLKSLFIETLKVEPQINIRIENPQKISINISKSVGGLGNFIFRYEFIAGAHPPLYINNFFLDFEKYELNIHDTSISD